MFLILASNMEKYISKTAAIFVALVVLLSTMSFTVDVSYCEGQLIDASISSKANPCEPEITTTLASDCCLDQKRCCSYQQIVVEGQNEIRINSFEELKLNRQLFVVILFHPHLDLFEALPKYIARYNEYSPPQLMIDLLVAHQVFLI